MAQTDQEWQRLGADLALCLTDLDEDEFLIIAHKARPYFVQFAAQGRFGMRVEAVSNAFIEDPAAKLTVEQYDAMVDAGWGRATNEPPTELGEEEPPDGSPNFFVDVAYPADTVAVAALAVGSLRDVYGVRHPGELEYRAFSSEGAEIRFPALRLKRRR